MKPSFDADIAKLERSREAAQRRDYLRNEFIEDAVMNGIGGNVKSALLSEGIETAFDVLNRDLEGISGVGDKRRATLLAWAESVDHAFRFDPRKDVPAAERRATVAKYRQRQRQLKTELGKQVSALRHLAQTAVDDVENARGALNAATMQLAQAQIDWLAVDWASSARAADD
jgi:DNA-binding helix-hairpin-helix protein with protein kinase domain